MNRLDHPLKPVLEAVRKVILSADARIREGIKWNSPSFRIDDYFATAGIRPSDNFVRVVFHCGAKAKGKPAAMQFDDSGDLLEWHAQDRCSAKFHDVKDVKTHAAVLRSIVRQWIRQM